MHKTFIAGLLWLAVAFPTFARSSVFRVTPKEPDGGGQVVFMVTSRAAGNGLAFHVTIVPKHGQLPADSKGYVCKAKFTESSKQIGPTTKDTQIALKAGKGVWYADFNASEQVLSSPDACFVLVILDHSGPAADFYVLKLVDFPTK